MSCRASAHPNHLSKAEVMKLTTASITDVKHVLFLFGDDRLGETPSNFRMRLLHTAMAATPAERESLVPVAPGLIEAFTVAKTHVNGVEQLRSIVKAELDKRDAALDLTAVHA